MHAIKCFYLDEEKQWLGYLPNFPDHWAHGETMEALQLNLYRLNFDLTPMEAMRKVSELSLPIYPASPLNPPICSVRARVTESVHPLARIIHEGS